MQPGEFAKIAVVLYAAVTLEKITNKGQHEVNKPFNILKILGIILLPVILIAMQPDYGTAISYVFALVLMLFVAGINKKFIFVSIALLVIILPILYFFVLPVHAKDRINVYLNPYLDPRGAGYNIIQSKLAIGGGRLLRTRLSKRNTNTSRIPLPQKHRFHICSSWRRNGICNVCSYSNTVCSADYKVYNSS